MHRERKAPQRILFLPHRKSGDSNHRLHGIYRDWAGWARSFAVEKSTILLPRKISRAARPENR
jgi:hypothetical protein